MLELNVVRQLKSSSLDRFVSLMPCTDHLGRVFLSVCRPGQRCGYLEMHQNYRLMGLDGSDFSVPCFCCFPTPAEV